jgi:hypothetical protein
MGCEGTMLVSVKHVQNVVCCVQLINTSARPLSVRVPLVPVKLWQRLQLVFAAPVSLRCKIKYWLAQNPANVSSRMERHVYQRTVVDIELAHYKSPSTRVGLVQRSLRHLMECRLF